MFIRNIRSKLTTFAYGVFQCCAKTIMFFFYHIPKEYVGRSIQNAVNTVSYIMVVVMIMVVQPVNFHMKFSTK